MEQIARKKIPTSVIYIALPSIRQQTNYSCGATCLRAICKYFKITNGSEEKFISWLKTTPEGTPPANIVTGAKELGLSVHSEQRMSIRKLKTFVKAGVPVICNVQAWGHPKQYADDKSGHYVVAIGFNDDNIYFMDPSADHGCRGFLDKKSFLQRWHDEETNGKKTKQLGIAIWKA